VKICQFVLVDDFLASHYASMTIIQGNVAKTVLARSGDWVPFIFFGRMNFKNIATISAQKFGEFLYIMCMMMRANTA